MKRGSRIFVVLFSIFAMTTLFAPVRAEGSGQVSTTGSGQIEGIVQPYVYQVVLPTYVDGCFDFIMDPQRLIEETNGAAYNGSSFEKGATVFFKRTDGRAEEDYSSSSDYMNIVNRSNVPIEVFVNVSMSMESLGGIALTGDRTFAEDVGASLYMALTDGDNTVPMEAGEACIHVMLPAAPEEAFEYTYNQEKGEYTYGLKEDLDGIQFPEYSFQLTAAVNESENWAFVEKARPLICVTWKVVPGKNIGLSDDKELNQDINAEQGMDINQDMEPNPEENGVQENYTVPEADAGLEGDANPDEEKPSDVNGPSAEMTQPNEVY